MIERIDIITVAQSQPNEPPAAEASIPENKSFKEIFFKSIEKVKQLQKDAATAIDKVLTAKTDDVAEVLAAAQKTDLAFKMLMQIQSKLADAYDEFRQMRI